MPTVHRLLKWVVAFGCNLLYRCTDWRLAATAAWLQGVCKMIYWTQLLQWAYLQCCWCVTAGFLVRGRDWCHCNVVSSNVCVCVFHVRLSEVTMYSVVTADVTLSAVLTASVCRWACCWRELKRRASEVICEWGEFWTERWLTWTLRPPNSLTVHRSTELRDDHSRY